VVKVVATLEEELEVRVVVTVPEAGQLGAEAVTVTERCVSYRVQSS